VLERAADDTRIGERLGDQSERVSRGLGIRVQEEQHVSVRRAGAGVQQRSTSAAARPQDSGAPRHRSIGARLITPGGDDDLRPFDARENRQRIDSPTERRCVAARWNDDRNSTIP